MELLTTPSVIVLGRAIILITVLAVVRKLILIDPGTTSPLSLFGLPAIIVALGVLHWLAVVVAGERGRPSALLDPKAS